MPRSAQITSWRVLDAVVPVQAGGWLAGNDSSELRPCHRCRRESEALSRPHSIVAEVDSKFGMIPTPPEDSSALWFVNSPANHSFGDVIFWTDLVVMTRHASDYRPLLKRYANYAPRYDRRFARYSESTLNKALEVIPPGSETRALLDVACGT